MKIEKDKYVTIDYTLKNKDGEVIDSSEGKSPLEFIHGYGFLISGLEKELIGKEENESFSVVIPPEEAYGAYDPNLVIQLPREQFDTDAEIEPGMQFQAGMPGSAALVTVTEVKDDLITIDANHFLAGKDLFFDVKILSVRDATQDELDALTQSCGCGCGCGDSCGGCGDSCDCGPDGCGSQGCFGN